MTIEARDLQEVRKTSYLFRSDDTRNLTELKVGTRIYFFYYLYHWLYLKILWFLFGDLRVTRILLVIIRIKLQNLSFRILNGICVKCALLLYSEYVLLYSIRQYYK